MFLLNTYRVTRSRVPRFASCGHGQHFIICTVMDITTPKVLNTVKAMHPYKHVLGGGEMNKVTPISENVVENRKFLQKSSK